MTPRERILAVLHGKKTDVVPFTIKRPQPPQGEVERKLRNEGLAVCSEKMVFSIVRPNVEVFRHEYFEKGRQCIRDTFRTPVGEVQQTRIVEKGGYGSHKISEYMISRPEDYKIVEFMAKDEVYTPTFDEFRMAEEIVGEESSM